MTNTVTNTQAPAQTGTVVVEHSPGAPVDELLEDVQLLAPLLEAQPMAMILADLKKDHKDTPESARLIAFLSAVFVSMAISQKRIADYLQGAVAKQIGA